ncbi:MAG: hypothetical protein KFF49_04580, partial [Bacteroidales bacterium]|nr:hypothetical protein [Bacteroidales bacterium]
YKQHPLNKQYDLDTALTSIWEFYKKWFGSLFVISFVFSLIITYISGRVDISDIYSVTDPEEMMAIAGSMIGPYFLILLFTFVFSLILQYYVLRKPVDPESNIVSIGSTGLARFFLPLLVLNIILALFALVAIMLGVLLLFVGALFAIVYVAMLYAFIAPVLMIERPDISDTIRTTISLAHKRFWPNMGWVAVFVILIMVISFVLGAIIMIPFGGSFIRTITSPENASELLDLTSRPSFIILNALANALTMPLFPIFSLVLYFNSRSGYTAGLISDKNDDDKGRPVKVEDLYADMSGKSKKKLNSQADPPPPSVDDLTP